MTDPDQKVYKSTWTTKLDGINHAVMVISEKPMTPRGLRKVLQKVAQEVKRVAP